MEKPFGTDLASAIRLNNEVDAVFPDSQVFRIDHFLARRRRRTSWPCASPTASSSRSGTASTSIRLIYDAMIGDHTLFANAQGIERLWEVSQPPLVDPPPVLPYAQGSWGPPRR